MNAQSALKTALREHLGPVVRRHGFKGSAPNWRKASPLGDWAVVNVQSSSFSNAQNLRCVVNLGFAPEPWLRWMSATLGTGMPKSVTESLGLYRQSLHPEGTPCGRDGWWDVHDGASADAAVTDMIVQLERNGWPVLEDMFSRDAMLARVRNGDLGFMKRSNRAPYFVRAEALLLMDDGWSDELEGLLDEALGKALPHRREPSERFDAWVRNEAGKV